LSFDNHRTMHYHNWDEKTHVIIRPSASHAYIERVVDSIEYPTEKDHKFAYKESQAMQGSIVPRLCTHLKPDLGEDGTLERVVSNRGRESLSRYCKGTERISDMVDVARRWFEAFLNVCQAPKDLMKNWGLHKPRSAEAIHKGMSEMDSTDPSIESGPSLDHSSARVETPATKQTVVLRPLHYGMRFSGSGIGCNVPQGIEIRGFELKMFREVENRESDANRRSGGICRRLEADYRSPDHREPSSFTLWSIF